MELIESGWQELKTTTGPKCPKLFYNFVANEGGYTIRFTDLIGFWSGVSQIVDIVSYGRVTRASIDPSDAEQLRVLLRKLPESLARGENTLRRDGETIDAILLQTVYRLPKPLLPLKWEFNLKSCGTEALAEHVLRPCLLEASESKHKVDYLCEVIESKDRVISKLLEKIEGTTIDLSVIFPGITGARSRKGQTTIKDAQKHVPHLKPFSKIEWLERAKTDGPYANFEMVGLSKLVSGCEQCPKHKSKQHEQWLDKLPKATFSASQATKERLESDSSNCDETESDSDKFETQKRRGQLVRRDEERVSQLEQFSKNDASEPAAVEMKDDLGGDTKEGKRRAETATPMGSSSPLPPLPFPSPMGQGQRQRTSSTATASSNESDLDTVNITTKSRLGKIGAKSRTLTKAPSANAPTSSSPAGLRNPSPSPELPSSPPPLPEILPKTSRPKSSSSIVTLSSLDPATPQKRKLGRLGTHRGRSESASVTPEHKRLRDERISDRGSSKIPSTQTTPSRRLGRIGRTASYLSRHQTFSSPVPEQGTEDQNQRCKTEDSDDSTASNVSSVSPESSLPGLTRQAKVDDPVQPTVNSTAATSQVQSSLLQLETQKPLSKGEKVMLRREDLKRKLGDIGTANNIGNTGLRKKRKF